MNRSRFGAHGEVKAHYDATARVLFIDLIGPFNVEFLRHYETVVGRERSAIDAPQWTSLVTIAGTAMAPFDAIEQAKQSIQGAMHLGLVATAIVLKVDEAHNVQKTFWSKVYENSGLPHDFFATNEDAFDWLQTKLPTSTLTANINPFKKVIK